MARGQARQGPSCGQLCVQGQRLPLPGSAVLVTPDWLSSWLQGRWALIWGTPLLSHQPRERYPQNVAWPGDWGQLPAAGSDHATL